MSLDVYLELGNVCVYEANITHNLNKMADAASIYKHLWRPEEIGVTKAKEIIDQLNSGLIELVMNPEKYEAFNSPNGWGMYEHFIYFCAKYLEACKKYPEATISVSR